MKVINDVVRCVEESDAVTDCSRNVIAISESFTEFRQKCIIIKNSLVTSSI